jgi:hypothetical protein
MSDLLAEWLASEVRPHSENGRELLAEIDAVLSGELQAREITGDRMMLLILPSTTWIATLWEEPERNMELPTRMLRDALAKWIVRESN